MWEGSPWHKDSLGVAVLLWLELALFLGDVLDLDLVLVSAHLIALDHLAVVGDAHLAGDLAALCLGVNLLDCPLDQVALLHWPLLAILVHLNTAIILGFDRGV